MSSKNYVIRVLDDPSLIDAAHWDALLLAQEEPTLFMRHAYLCALHDQRCAVPETGWTPRFVTLYQGDILVAACPAYLKAHSFGEYVFDWAWADAYQRHGLAYYPKLVVAVPFTPIAGSRWLARDDAARSALRAALLQVAQTSGASSIHTLFLPACESAGAEPNIWLNRQTVQFHWANRAPLPYASFAEFLHSLQRDKRKKISQERRRVGEAGITFRALEGAAIDAQSWAFFHRCYTATYQAHGSSPYLNEAFFHAVSARLPRHWLLFIAQQDGRDIAASLLALDPDRRIAYGRYWGCLEAVPLLHFEACYYQPIQWCIEQGYAHFEGGAQGEHKLARGLLPVATHSTHWLAHPGFYSAVSDYLENEGRAAAAYLDELNEHTPFRGA